MTDNAEVVDGKIASAPAPAVTPQPVMLQCVVPEGCAPGAMLSMPLPTGQMIQVQVPAGVGPGQAFNVQVNL